MPFDLAQTLLFFLVIPLSVGWAATTERSANELTAATNLGYLKPLTVQPRRKNYKYLHFSNQHSSSRHKDKQLRFLILFPNTLVASTSMKMAAAEAGGFTSKDSSDAAAEGSSGSFVLDVFRPYVMKIHPRNLRPKFDANRKQFFQFLTDSYHVFNTMENMVASISEFQSLKNSGIERSAAIAKDIEMIKTEYPDDAEASVSEKGTAYAELLKQLGETNIGQFLCHVYNIHFAHNAGGRAVGRDACATLFPDKKLAFYEPIDYSLYEDFTKKMDVIINDWTDEMKQEILNGVPDVFEFGRGMLEIIFPDKELKLIPKTNSESAVQ